MSLNHTQIVHHIPCIIIQNNLGLTIVSLSKKVPLPPLVADVEAMAVVQALAFAQDIGLSSIILKGDLKVVMTTLESNDDLFASFGLLIIDAHLFIVTFNHNSFSHACRQVNSVAHNLVRHVRYVSSLSV